MAWLNDAVNIAIALILVALNGFLVAAEFALVKGLSQIEQLVKAKQPFAKTARWLAQRLDESLSACQLRITMASLASGWVGEPAFAHLRDSGSEGRPHRVDSHRQARPRNGLSRDTELAGPKPDRRARCSAAVASPCIPDKTCSVRHVTPLEETSRE